MTGVRLRDFRPIGLDRGASKPVEACWYITKVIFFLSSLPWPQSLKIALLRGFGARVGTGFVLRPRVNIHFPWKLTIGNDCWIGERCEILNLAAFTMGSNSALAHDVYIAAAGHDITSPWMQYKNQPIAIGDGSWVATRSYIGPGVTVGNNCVIAAGASVVRDVPDNTVVGGVPARPIAKRKLRER